MFFVAKRCARNCFMRRARLLMLFLVLGVIASQSYALNITKQRQILIGSSEEQSYQIKLEGSVVGAEEKLLDPEKSLKLSLSLPTGEPILENISGDACFFDINLLCFYDEDIIFISFYRDVIREFNMDGFARTLVDAFETKINRPSKVAKNANLYFAVLWVDDFAIIDSAKLKAY